MHVNHSVPIRTTFNGACNKIPITWTFLKETIYEAIAVAEFFISYSYPLRHLEIIQEQLEKKLLFFYFLTYTFTVYHFIHSMSDLDDILL